MTDTTYSRLADPIWTPYLRRWHTRRFPNSDVLRRAEPVAPTHDLKPPPDVQITWDKRLARAPGDRTRAIIAECAKLAGCPIDELIGPRRSRSIVLYRHAAIYIIVKHCGRLSLPQIGRLFGDRDHSSVIHARNKVIADLAAGGERFYEIIRHVEDQLNLCDASVLSFDR